MRGNLSGISKWSLPIAGALLALVAFIPFVPGLATGGAFFFRDLGTQYFPRRQFAAEGLRQGELRYWNPYLHEGEPVKVPLGYPPDLLHVAQNDARWQSATLAAHVPLAAIAALLLGRGLGLSTFASSGFGLVYALGGFLLSCLNLSVILQGAAWAPLLALALIRAARDGGRAVALAAPVMALPLLGLGLEVALQAALLGGVLALSPRGVGRQVLRMGTVAALAVGLAAPVVLVFLRLTGAGARAGGLPTEMALAFSVHPVALLQVLVAHLFGEIPTSLRAFWGHRFFSGFPYFLSLYLGAAVLSVAAVGALRGERQVRRILGLGLLGLFISLGSHAGLAPVLEAFPALRAMRFPVKAFFLVHITVALLFGHGLEALVGHARRAPWKLLAGLALGSGLALLAAGPLAHLLPGVTGELARGFFPAAYSAARRRSSAEIVLGDAAVGGLAAIVVGLAALAVIRRLLSPRLGGLVVVAVVAADLLRAGIPVNPMMDASLLAPSPERRRVAETVAAAGGRLFTCDPARSRALFDLLSRSKARDDLLLALALAETLTPEHNVGLKVRTAYGQDTSGLVPATYALPDLELGCSQFPALVARLRRAGVSHVLSADPVAAPGVELVRVLTPARLGGLPVGLYRIADPLPLREVARHVWPASSQAEAERLAGDAQEAPGIVVVEGYAHAVEDATGRVLTTDERTGRIEIEAEAGSPTVLIVRDSFALGWAATVNGVRTPVLRANGRHRAVPIPRGRSRVILTYHPPGRSAGWVLALLSASALAGICLHERRAARARRVEP